MATSWTKRADQFKSPLRVVAGVLLRSRAYLAGRAQRLKVRLQEFEKINAKQERTIASLTKLAASKDAEIRRLRNLNEKLRKESTSLAGDPPLPNHEFGPKMISLAVNCACTVGLRAAERVLVHVRDWLGVDFRIPSWSGIRSWLLRLGLARIALPESFQQADDWIWIADHSNQIGKEKVLTVLAVRASQLPPPGQALRHQDVTVLCNEPGIQWNENAVAKVYLELEAKFGTPRGVLSDGATELQNAAKQLENPRQIATDVFRDLKHIAANIFEAELGKTLRFKEFTAMLGQTRSSIQQTELSHLTPPEKKVKARFMNLASNLRWAQMALWGLQHPDAELRKEIGEERMENKLGWLREFESELLEWNECQRIISTAVTFAAEQGIWIGAAEALRREIGDTLPQKSPQQVRSKIVAFFEATESKLKPGERLPISTEILESTFGLYKSLERQHSKGGFTSLILALPALLKPVTPEFVKSSLPKFGKNQVQSWIKNKLGKTLTSKRTAAYAEHKKATHRATTLVATI